MEDDFNGRKHQWKTPLMEDTLNRRQFQWPQCKTSSIEDDNNGGQLQC